MTVETYFEQHWLIKKFGVGIMNYPARDVEAMSVIEDVRDAFELHQVKKERYEMEKAKRRRR